MWCSLSNGIINKMGWMQAGDYFRIWVCFKKAYSNQGFMNGCIKDYPEISIHWHTVILLNRSPYTLALTCYPKSDVYWHITQRSVYTDILPRSLCILTYYPEVCVYWHITQKSVYTDIISRSMCIRYVTQKSVYTGISPLKSMCTLRYYTEVFVHWHITQK